MINKFYRRKYRRLIFSFLMAIALISSLVFSPEATAKLFDGPVDRLPLEQRVSLRRGEVIMIGKKGQYTSLMLAKSSMDNVWQVLTDYDHFAEFLPGVISSKLIETDGDRKIFEQTNKIKTFVFSTESRLEVAATESYPQRIAFKAIAGDLKTMNGTWLLQPVSPYPSAPPDRVLITHTVTVEPAKTPIDSIFFNIYEDQLAKTLKAIKQETEKRSGKKKEPINLTES